jgi:hypothetical protein
MDNKYHRKLNFLNFQKLTGRLLTQKYDLE